MGHGDSNPRPLERDGQTDRRTLINCVDLTNYVEVRKYISATISNYNVTSTLCAAMNGAIPLSMDRLYTVFTWI